MMTYSVQNQFSQYKRFNLLGYKLFLVIHIYLWQSCLDCTKMRGYHSNAISSQEEDKEPEAQNHILILRSNMRTLCLGES